MTPPFAGQGLNSGVRDALNLGWKLVAVLTQGVPSKLLESYEPERWTHAKELIDMAVNLGAQIQPTDPETAAMRDAAFAELGKDHDAMGGFVGGIFKALLDRYFSEGFALGLGEEYLAGRMISQPTVTDEAGQSVLLDTYLGEGFAILGYNCDPVEEIGEEMAGQWRNRGVALVGLYDQEGGALTIPQNSHLAELFGHGSANLLLLRPDRFCLAAFDRASAPDVLSQAAKMLGYQ